MRAILNLNAIFFICLRFRGSGSNLGAAAIYFSLICPALAVGGTVHGASQSVRALESLLPPATIATAKVNGLERFAGRLEEHPLFSLWQEDDVQRFFAPLVKGWKDKAWTDRFEKELGLSGGELLKQFSGEALVAVTDLNFDDSLEERVRVGIVALFDTQAIWCPVS